MNADKLFRPPRTIMEAYQSLQVGTFVQLIHNQIIMSPSPLGKHLRLSHVISSNLFLFIQKHNPGTASASPYHVYLNEEKNFQPILSIFPRLKRI